MRTINTNGGLAAAQRVICAVAVASLAACATRMDQAPVVDRSGTLATQGSAQAPLQAAPLGPPPPGYYRVKPGDTLYRIALENGQNYRDIATWNNLTNPNQIEVDQLLRVVPPGANAAAVTPGVATAPIVGGGVQTAPLSSAPASPAQSSPSTPNAGNGASAGSTVPPIVGGASMATAIPPQPAAPSSSSAPAPAAGTIKFAWPARGPLIAPFNESANKGINIGGAQGDPVKAAADGRVVYAGNGLRGYGNLIIIKHDATYLTAYAHNSALMVKEGDSVTRGQKIAEMGSTDAPRVMLHFEVRQQGKPVDPMKYLPPQ